MLDLKTLIPQWAGSNAFLLLHYMLAYWPIHFWVVLEHFQRALQEECSQFDDASRFIEPWNGLLDRGDYWCEEMYREQTLTLLGSLIDIVADYFRFYRWRVWHKENPFGGGASREGILLADRLKSPTQGEWVIPYPWEDVTSVIRRASGKMGYDHPAWMLITADTPHQKVYAPGLPVLHRRTDYLVLERQLGLDEERLYRLTLHQWREIFLPRDSGKNITCSPSVSGNISQVCLSQAQAEDFCIPLERTKVCPVCLDEEGAYDRLFWRLRSMILCPHHALVLADCCPHCSAFVPAFRPSPTICTYCGIGDYRRSRCPQISSTSWLYSGQLLLLYFLTGEVELSRDSLLSFASSPLLRVQPWQYFRLLDAFHFLLLRLPSNSVLLHSLSASIGTEELATIASPTIQVVAVHTAFFHYLFADWPKHLLLVLEHFSSLLRVNEIGRELFESFWDSDALIQRFFPSNQEGESGDSYQRLNHVLKTLSFWGMAIEFPRKVAPLPPSYLSAKREQQWDIEKHGGEILSLEFW